MVKIVNRIPSAINYTRLNTRVLTNIVNSVKRYAEINWAYYVIFKPSASFQTLKGEGAPQRALIWLPGPREVKGVFPLDLHKYGIGFKQEGERVLDNYLEMIVFVIAHEAKHALGVTQEDLCNDFAWEYLDFFKKNTARILRKPLARYETFVLDIEDEDDGSKSVAKFSIGK